MANYVSKHTGAEIDAAVDKTGELDGKVATLTEEIGNISIGANPNTSTPQNYDFAFEVGSLSPGKGFEIDSTTRIRTDYIPACVGDVVWNGDTQYDSFIVYEYGIDRGYVLDTTWMSDKYTVTTDGYIRILVRKSDNGAVTENEIEGLTANLSVSTSVHNLIGSTNAYNNSVLNLKKGVAYIANNAAISYAVDKSSGNCILTLGSHLCYYHGPTYESMEWQQADILAALPNNAVASGTLGAVITVPYRSALCINPNNKTIVIRALDKMKADEYVLVYNGWGNASGHLIQKALMYSNGDHEARLDVLESKTLDEAYLAPVKRYAAKFNNGNAATDAFLWFTDPHLAQIEDVNYENLMYTRLREMKNVYDATPCHFAVCGGDWLSTGDVMEDACYKLGMIDGSMKRTFNRYYHCVGNHDTNESGKLTAESEKGTGQLTAQTITNLWNREHGANYFSFEGANATFYVLDSHQESNNMDEYRWTQIDWLAGKLKEDDAENSAIMLHIIFPFNAIGTLHTFADKVSKIAAAYNSHGTVSLNGKSYDFAGCTGKVRFVLGGHVHEDANKTVEGIPMIATINVRASNSMASFDLVYADWTAGTLHLVRVGSGEDQQFTMA